METLLNHRPTLTALTLSLPLGVLMKLPTHRLTHTALAPTPTATPSSWTTTSRPPPSPSRSPYLALSLSPAPSHRPTWPRRTTTLGS